ncbi:siderophore-interacting protein [Leucobacter muris]|uniref:Siderophore-interacting protein n=1 Tax=Leucobacter muris TaxID=1935379 RepID=A0ABX5QGQ4_9MICO|nr:siderophore-interacting protein [Leucobacter muris]QAB18276.1 siderophore-interacting protein [Leucobacter muris]
MRRVTLTGEQLGAFTTGGVELPAFASPAFDDHVKLIFASDGDVGSVLPLQLPHGIEWEPSETRQGRDYTPRRYDPGARELDLDFVLHGEGPAASWARDARPGDELWFAGPKSSTVVPADVDWVLLAGDETALPAIARFFEERPVAAPVRAVVVLSDAEARQELAVGQADAVEWVVADAGDETALAAAVERVEPLPGTPYVWAAAESRSLLAVRRRARALGAPKSHVNITGYWHLRDEEDRSGDAAPGGAAAGAPGVSVGLPSPPVEWFAVRAALRLGLLDAVADGALGIGALAARLGVGAASLRVLADALTAGGILAIEGGEGTAGGSEDGEAAGAARAGEDARIGLGRLGEELVEDEHARERFDGMAADQVLALAALPEAMTGGGPAWRIAHRSTLRQTVVADADEYAELVEHAEGAASVFTGLPASPVWRGHRRIAVTGPGALAVAEALRATVDAPLTVVEEPGPLGVLREAAGEDPDVTFSANWDGHELAVAALALAHRTDGEARELLAQLREAAPAAVLVEQLTPDGLSPASRAHGALVDLGTLGDPPRTAETVLSLAAEAGWRVAARRKLGWGVEAVELVGTEPSPACGGAEPARGADPERAVGPAPES